MGTLFNLGSNGTQAPNARWSENASAGQKLGLDSGNAVFKSSNDMLPVQQQQTNQAVGAANEAYRSGVGEYDRFGGLRDRAVSDANNFNNADYRERYAQEAGENVAQGLRQAQGQNDRYLASRGVSGNSGAALALRNDAQNESARQQANAQNMARQVALEQGFKLNDRAAGYTGTGLQMAGAAGALGAGGMTAANAGLTGMNSGFTTAGKIGLGTADSATGMYGVNTKANAADAAAKNQYSGMFSDDLGSLSGGMMGGGNKGAGSKGGSMFDNMFSGGGGTGFTGNMSGAAADVAY
jgi:hypothetical protein